MPLRMWSCQNCRIKFQHLQVSQADPRGPAACPQCHGQIQEMITAASQPMGNRPSSDRAKKSSETSAYYEIEKFKPNFPHWDPELRAMGAKVSAHEMLTAGKAIDAAASEWTPCRSDADKQAEYAEEADMKLIKADYEAAAHEIAQGAPVEAISA